MSHCLDARFASALELSPDASDEELANAVARLGDRRSPRSKETVAVLVEAARAAEKLMADRLFEPISSAEVANLIDQDTDVKLTVRDKAARELGVAPHDLVWLLGEDLYDCLIDAGLLRPPS